MASIHLGACLSGGWKLFKRNPVNHVVAWLLVGVVGSISAGLLIGPMMVGYMRMMAKEDRGESTQLGDLFRGFDDFVPAFVAGLISSLVLWVGFMLCVLPGLLIAALPMVALYLVATGEGDGVAAFSRAWQVVTKNLMASFVGMLVLGMVGALGLLLCWVGVLVTGPVSMIAMYYLARQLVGDEPELLPAP